VYCTPDLGILAAGSNAVETGGVNDNKSRGLQSEMSSCL